MMSRNIFLATLLTVLTIFAGAQQVVKLQPGSFIKTTGGIVFNMHNMSLENDGTINQAPGEGRFVFSGANDNSIGGTGITVFDILQMNKTGKLLLLHDLSIGSKIEFNTGLIDLNNNNILLQSNALLEGESENTRIMSTSGGYVEISKILNVPSAENPGNLGAMITSLQNPGSTVIRRGHQSQIIIGGNGNSVLRYYDIMPANNSGLNATLRFNYFDAELNGLSEPVLVMWKSTDGVNWLAQGYTSRDATANYVEKTGITDFSRWTLSAINNPLPVQFLLFNVRCINNSKVLVTWKTAQEINASHFEIQRSTNGTNWVTVGTIAAAGNSNTIREYIFTDSNPLVNAMYRIAEFDVDNKVQYTSINRAECGVINVWKIWPNPVTGQLFLTIGANSNSKAMIKVFDSKGSLLKQQINDLLLGSNQLNIDMKQLPAATYNVEVTWDNGLFRKTTKIIKQ